MNGCDEEAGASCSLHTVSPSRNGIQIPPCCKTLDNSSFSSIKIIVFFLLNDAGQAVCNVLICRHFVNVDL